MAPNDVQHSDDYNNVRPNSDQDPNENPPKRIKYDSTYENMIFRAGYTNMQNQYIYNQQRSQALRMQDDRYSTISSSSSLVSSMDGYSSTPSPDLTLNGSQASSPLFAVYPQRPVDPPPLRYFQFNNQQPPPDHAQRPEHSYAVDSPQSSPPISNSSEPENRPARARVTSDSGNSTVPSETGEIGPVSMDDWFRIFQNHEIASKSQRVHLMIQARSAQRKEQYLSMRMPELPTDLEYNPNKSRLRKAYVSPTEAAERERNNLASRKSRFKKKIAQQITNMHLEFDRSENAELYAMQNFMSQIIYDLEAQCLDSGIAPIDMLNMRQAYGFTPSQHEKIYTAASSR
ncbi:uncharacterized protein LOC134212181 [Armigeres subalbatus]|uniref:uncharacterized protein LOC134212181 n=1 Tax=Armigeres subalbatus TaxID=124917 RepID=UPI002ED68BAB